MTKEELIDIISKYTDLKNEAEERLTMIETRVSVSVQEVAAYCGTLEIYYTRDQYGDNELYNIDLPYEFLTAAPGEELNSVINAYYAEQRRKKEEQEERSKRAKEERERAEYERLKQKFEKEYKE